MSLQQKVAIVTGAGTGIGKAIALRYAQQGASVVLAGRNEERHQDVVQQITATGGTAAFFRTDVGQPEDCEQLVAYTLARFGRLDIACNNAGLLTTPTPVADFGLSDWQNTINTNLNGVFYCMKYQLPAMLRSGGGAIINMSSVGGKIAKPGMSAYVASKHAIIGLSIAAALEYARAGIRVNTVGPAFIDTPMVRSNFPPEVIDLLPEMHPVGRMGTTDEVAQLVAWLSSDEASFITGSYYPIDGGYLAQ